MKVVELIEQLQKVDPQLEVETEGCDCINRAGNIEVKGDTALITIGGVEPRPIPRPPKSLSQIERELGL